MTTPMDLADAFQPNYRTSRERLLAGAHALAPRLGTLVDSRAIAQRGPDGETLALDFTVFGARRPRHALVLSSGTHGVEGYTGSASTCCRACAWRPAPRSCCSTRTTRTASRGTGA